MKGTDNFKAVIKQYIEDRAQTDSLFAFNLEKPNKNIDDCVTYILNEVKKSGCNGFADDEIYNMAVHYYDEDNIEVGEKVNATVVVNHVVELTEADKNEAKEKAVREFIAEQKNTLKTAKTKPTPKEKKVIPVQTSLFD